MTVPSLKPPRPPVAKQRRLSPMATLASFAFLSSVLLFIVFAGVWMWQGNLEESITAFGQIVPEGKLRRVMSPTGGIISKVYVEENQVVKAGDVLVELDLASADIEQSSLNTQLAQLQDEARVLQAAYNGGGANLSKSSYGSLQNAWLRATRQTVQAEMAAAEKQTKRFEHELRMSEERYRQAKALMDNSEERLVQYEQLHQEGGLSLNDLQSFKQNVIEQRGTFQALEEEVEARRLALEESYHRPAQLTGAYNQNILDRLTNLEQKISVLQRDLDKTALFRKRQQILAPIDGTVHQLDVRGAQEVVQQGDMLISIVPKDAPLVAEVRVPNTDLGFVHIGQDAKIGLDAFPIFVYGHMQGEVASISASTVNDQNNNMPYYLVRVRLDANQFEKDGQTYPLRSGMTLMANLITRDKNILSFFTEPLFEHVDKAFRDPTTR